MDINKETMRLLKEDPDGNVEYKRHLCRLTEDRIDHLSTQMNWRINEAFLTSDRSEAVYLIGIENDGCVSGIDSEDILESLESLKTLAYRCYAKIESTQIITNRNGMVARVIIERKQLTNIYESSIFVLGTQFVGKTTMISVLLNGKKDDGNGSLRNALMKHPHELDAGGSSSISYHLIGFNDMNLINSNLSELSWDYIVHHSDRVMTIIDLPGNLSYINTILFGLMSHQINSSMILVDSQINEIDSMTEIVIDWAIILKRKFMIVITKIDLITKEQLHDLLILINTYLATRHSYTIRVMNKSEDVDLIPMLYKINKIPVFYTSNITHDHIDLLIHALALIKPDDHDLYVEKPVSKSKEFIINSVNQIPYIGWIVSGRVSMGTININDRLILGQVKGKYVDVVVQSIYHKQIMTKSLSEGCTGSFVLQILDDKHKIIITNKMVIISPNLLPNFVHCFMLVFDNDISWIRKIQYNLFTGNQTGPFIAKEIKKSESDTMIIGEFVVPEIYRYIRNGDPAVIKLKHNIAFGKIFTLHFLICN